MEVWSWSINMLGIIVSAIGSWCAYVGASKDTMGFEYRMPTMYTREETEEMYKKYKKRKKCSSIGFLLLIIGFFILATAQLFALPFN